MAVKITSTDDSYYPRKLTRQEGAKAYAALRREIYAAGILDREYWYYVFLTLADVGGLLLSFAMLILVTHWAAVLFASASVAKGQLRAIS